MPFGSSKAAMMGAAGAGGGFGYEYSGSKNEYTNWNSTGYTFVELTTSGSLEFTGDGTIDMVVVGGGGGGRWYTYCGSSGGAGASGKYDGTPASGTWWPNEDSSAGIGGNGAGGEMWDAGGGAGGGSGGGYDTQNSRKGQNMPGTGSGWGGQGIRWQNYGYAKNGSVSTTTNAFYGAGDGRGQYLNPTSDSHSYSSWGKGAAWLDGAGHGASQDGVVILRFEDL